MEEGATYPWESTVSFALSSVRDRREKSFRRIWGSLSGWRQLRRMGTRWGSASPRAGPATHSTCSAPVLAEGQRALPAAGGGSLLDDGTEVTENV